MPLPVHLHVILSFSNLINNSDTDSVPPELPMDSNICDHGPDTVPGPLEIPTDASGSGLSIAETDIDTSDNDAESGKYVYSV